jgi:hypothetical protein
MTVFRMTTRRVRSPRSIVMLSDLQAQNDPAWPNEGSDSEECREATERILRGPWGWLLVIASAVIVALAFNGGYL